MLFVWTLIFLVSCCVYILLSGYVLFNDKKCIIYIFLLIKNNFTAVLAAGAPQTAPFMADECLLAMPDVDGLDYTMKEYMRFVDYVKACVERLNSREGMKFQYN